ncbi:MAG: RNA-guided endonuclease InsQ/TnpB family protein, partial [Dissulfurispiraceae bacterium]
VFMEDLRVSCMSRSARGTVDNPGTNVAAKSGLNKAILDQGWGMFREMLHYKLIERGGVLVLVNPKHTSQRCSACLQVSSESRRSQRVFQCVVCGMSIDADLNAALNILAAGQAVLACGEGGPLPSVKQEPAGKRELVPPQKYLGIIALQGGEDVNILHHEPMNLIFCLQCPAKSDGEPYYDAQCLNS